MVIQYDLKLILPTKLITVGILFV